MTIPEQLFPELLKDLLSNPANVEYKHFHDQIRQYNASLAFASMNAKTITLPGVYVYKVHGQIYHSIGNMHPEIGVARQNSQLYIIDSEEAVHTRMGHGANSKLRPVLLTTLDLLLRDKNEYARKFRMLGEVEKEQTEICLRNNLPPPTVSMVFKKGGDNYKR